MSGAYAAIATSRCPSSRLAAGGQKSVHLLPVSATISGVHAAAKRWQPCHGSRCGNVMLSAVQPRTGTRFHPNGPCSRLHLRLDSGFGTLSPPFNMPVSASEGRTAGRKTTTISLPCSAYGSQCVPGARRVLLFACASDETALRCPGEPELIRHPSRSRLKALSTAPSGSASRPRSSNREPCCGAVASNDRATSTLNPQAHQSINPMPPKPGRPRALSDCCAPQIPQPGPLIALQATPLATHQLAHPPATAWQANITP